jgi:tetratricopeptide (TPR) repeat protein
LNLRFESIVLFAATAALPLLQGCQRAPVVPPIPLPNLTEAYAEVREVVQQRHAALQEDPESAATWGKYALTLDAHEYTNTAEECYRVAIKLNPAAARWKYLLAIKLKGQSPSQAEALLAQLTGRANAELAELICHIDVLNDLGKAAAADEILAKANEVFSSHPAVLFRMARQSFESQDFGDAVVHLDSVRGKFRECVRLQRRLLAVGQQTKAAVPDVRDEENLPSVDQMIQDPHTAAVFSHRRDPLWRGKQAAERARAGDPLGMNSLMGLVNAHPELIDNRLQFALLTAERGGHQQAEQIVREGLRLAPTTPRLLSGLAALSMLQEDWTESKIRLNDLLLVEPESIAGWSDLAFVLEQLEDVDPAIAAYDKVLSLAPDDAELAARRDAVQQRAKEKGRLP